MNSTWTWLSWSSRERDVPRVCSLHFVPRKGRISEPPPTVWRGYFPVTFTENSTTQRKSPGKRCLFLLTAFYHLLAMAISLLAPAVGLSCYARVLLLRMPEFMWLEVSNLLNNTRRRHCKRASMHPRWLGSQILDHGKRIVLLVWLWIAMQVQQDWSWTKLLMDKVINKDTLQSEAHNLES